MQSLQYACFSAIGSTVALGLLESVRHYFDMPYHERTTATDNLQ